MIELTITRVCLHEEKIAIMGFSGKIKNIPTKYYGAVIENINDQKDRICFNCFKQLSFIEKMELIASVK
jgi:hypothetical protein